MKDCYIRRVGKHVPLSIPTFPSRVFVRNVLRETNKLLVVFPIHCTIYFLCSWSGYLWNECSRYGFVGSFTFWAVRFHPKIFLINLAWFLAVLWIRDILVQIRILGSVLLTCRSGSCYFRQLVIKKFQNSTLESRFFYYFCFVSFSDDEFVIGPCRSTASHDNDRKWERTRGSRDHQHQ